MKKKDLNELKTKTNKDLAKKVIDLERELTAATLELKMGKVKNVHVVRSKKKDIAAILTIMKLKSYETVKAPRESEGN